SFMDDLICSVCSEEYSSEGREAVMLPVCGHTFCRPCLVSIENDYDLTCPYCRAEHEGPPVEELPINYAVNNVAMSNKKSKDDTCDKHDGGLLIFWCRKCRLSLCGECIFEAHLTENHGVVKIKDLVEESKGPIEEKAKKVLKTLQESKTDVQRKFHKSIIKIVKLCGHSGKIDEFFREAEKILLDIKHTKQIQQLIVGETLLDHVNASVVLLSNNQKQKLGNQVESNQSEDATGTAFVSTAQVRDQFGNYNDCPWPLRCCIMSDDGRRARLCWEEERLHLYSLTDQLHDAHFLIPMFCIQALLPSNPVIFMDLSIAEETLGRVYIKLDGEMQRAQHFLLFCLGTYGPSYRGSCFISLQNEGEPGECLSGGEYVTDDSSSREGLMDDLEWGTIHSRPQKAGQLVAGQGNYNHPSIQDLMSDDNSDEDENESHNVEQMFELDPDYNPDPEAVFSICLRENPKKRFACVFGEVDSGMEILVKAAAHHTITEIVIAEVGVVVPTTN
ncbi:unnamed protein product, partial [Meganyctiphanes norvegica]